MKLLLCILIIVFILYNGAKTANAQETVVYVDPPSYEVQQVGDTFSINVSIANVADLYGYEFTLWYNTTMMDCIGVEWPSDHFLKPVSPPLFKWAIINDTLGGVKAIATLTGKDEPPKNGSGVLVTITFRAVTIGDSSSLQLDQVKLSDRDANQIPCSTNNGQVTIIPEFNHVSVISLLITIALIILFYKKKQKQTKNQNWSSFHDYNAQFF